MKHILVFSLMLIGFLTACSRPQSGRIKDYYGEWKIVGYQNFGGHGLSDDMANQRIGEKISMGQKEFAAGSRKLANPAYDIRTVPTREEYSLPERTSAFYGYRPDRPKIGILDIRRPTDGGLFGEYEILDQHTLLEIEDGRFWFYKR